MKESLPRLRCIKKHVSSSYGFTFIEIIIVIGIISMLFAIGIVSIMNIPIIATNSTSTSVIISDIKTQQIKAMSGDTEGRGVPDTYGVRIEPNRYTLYHGQEFNPSDTSNFSIPITDGFTLTTNFPDSTIVFASGSGDIINFIDGQNTITLTKNDSSQRKVIHFNQYGAVTAID